MILHLHIFGHTRGGRGVHQLIANMAWDSMRCLFINFGFHGKPGRCFGLGGRLRCGMDSWIFFKVYIVVFVLLASLYLFRFPRPLRFLRGLCVSINLRSKKPYYIVSTPLP